jgi:hypothetical protein
MSKTNENALAPAAQSSTLEADQARWNELHSKLGTKSAAIRYLAADGWKRGRIAKAGNLLYQHVRNVLTQPVKKAVEPTETN